VVISEPDPARRARAAGLGAGLGEVVAADPAADSVTEIVAGLTGGVGADVVFELSGARTAIGEGLQLAAVNGRYLVAGTVGGGEQPILGHLIARRGLTIVGSLGAEIDAYYKAMELLRAQRSRFDWSRLLGGRYSLDEATIALRRMQDYSETKAVLVP
jgi:threonine dehydrogenase-like Zn-dependent dehydrogenase